jgi:hypothetical protein
MSENEDGQIVDPELVENTNNEENEAAAAAAAAEAEAAAEAAKTANKGNQNPTTPIEIPAEETIGEGVKIVWGTQSYQADFSTKTADASQKKTNDLPADSDVEKPTDQEIDAYMRDSHEEEKLSLEDLRITAELVVELVDAVNSTAIGAWTKESSERFELENDKKRTLVTLLTKVFYIYQTKLGPLAGLVIAALLYFGMTWKAGWDVKKVKKEDEERKAIEERKARNRERIQKHRNRITSAIGLESLPMKKIATKMGVQVTEIKEHLKDMCDKGELFADHSEAIVKYKLA